MCAAADAATEGLDDTAAAIDADVGASAAVVAATLGFAATDTAHAHLVGVAATIAADQLILATCVTDARCAGWAALLRARASCRATHQSANTPLVTGAAVAVAGSPFWTALAVQALLGAGAAGTCTACTGAGTCAKDADEVAITLAAGAAATVWAAGTAVARWYTPGRRLGRFLVLVWFLLFLLFSLAFGGRVFKRGQPQAKAQHEPGGNA